jgi:hypothetical protein
MLLVLFEHVMGNLRRQVRLLEEHELFEQTLMKQSQVGQSPLPSTNDIDALMRSMMGYSEANTQPQRQSSAYPTGQPQDNAHRQPGPGTILSGLDVLNAPVMPVGGTFWSNAPDLNDVFPNGYASGRNQPSYPSQPW